jgi:threonine dehydratase
MSIPEIQNTQTLVEKAYSFFGMKYKPSPLQEVEIEGQKLFLKRDDLLELGCSKQRSLIPMIYSYLQEGKKKFVVSSSGNAGLVSAFCALNSSEIEEMVIFLSNQITDNKLVKFEKIMEINFVDNVRLTDLKYKNITLKFVVDPRIEAIRLSMDGYLNLRGSVDDLALKGFETIAYELAAEIPKLKEIYVPASSGTTVKGIFEGFSKISQFTMPKIHVVQTTKTFTLIRNVLKLDRNFSVEQAHPADSIVDIVGHRHNQIFSLINVTGGNAWVISTTEVEHAQQKLLDAGIETSYDSALTYAAFLKNKDRGENSILIFTG